VLTHLIVNHQRRNNPLHGSPKVAVVFAIVITQ
jgi:hypothetical protein